MEYILYVVQKAINNSIQPAGELFVNDSLRNTFISSHKMQSIDIRIDVSDDNSLLE